MHTYDPKANNGYGGYSTSTVNTSSGGYIRLTVVSAKTKGTLYTTKTKVLLRNSKVLLRNSLPLNIITPTSELSIFERATSYRLEVQ